MSTAVGAAPLAERLARFYGSLRFESIPEEVVRKAIDLIAFDMTLALRGHRTADATQAMAIVSALDDRGGPATIIGTDLRAQPINAAFANATLMRALECDDVLFPVGVHAGLVVLPPALALAERDRLSGAELLTAMIAGYSIIGRLGNETNAWAASQPRRPTIPFGAFGGAVACGLLRHLDAERLMHAIGYAAHSAMGLAAGEWVHYYSLVARNGLMCALLAEAGARVEPSILEVQYGFFDTFFGDVPKTLVEMDVEGGAPDEILQTSTKRYPGTGLNNPAIELTRDLVRSEGLTPERIDRIALTLAEDRRNFAISYSLGPYERWRACSSMPFQIAMVIVDGGVTDWSRYEQPDHPGILALVRRMSVSFEPGHPERWVRMDVRTTDGRRVVRESDRVNFPPIDARAELVAAGDGIVPEAKLARAADLLERLPSLDDVGALMECFVP